MRQRVITAVIALLIFIPIIVAGGIWIDIAGVVLAEVALSEILIMRKKLLVSGEAIISGIGMLFVVAPDNWLAGLPNGIDRPFIIFLFVLMLLLRTVLSRSRFSYDDAAVISLSMVYIGMGFHYFIAARHVSLAMVFFVLFIVWVTDSGAYMFGRQFGQHKLAPTVSPNKTWEGSIGGTVAAVILLTIYVAFVPVANHSLVTMAAFILVFSITGQFGDLIESALKRYYGVKDSGKILPGHGGILDRFDSLLLVLPIVHLFGLI